MFVSFYSYEADKESILMLPRVLKSKKLHTKEAGRTIRRMVSGNRHTKTLVNTMVTGKMDNVTVRE